MRLTKQDEYAILFVTELALLPKNALLSLSDFSKQHSVSILVMKRIASGLIKRGIITSREGARGGYVLHKKPQDICISEIIQSHDEKKSDSLALSLCPLLPGCIPKQIFSLVTDTVNTSLQTLTVRNLISVV